MSFDFLRLTSAAVIAAVAATAPLPAAAKPLKGAACKKLDQERVALLRDGVDKAIVNGPEWTRANMPPETLDSVERYLLLEEQLRFRCGRRKLPALAPQNAKTKPEPAKADITGSVTPAIVPPRPTPDTGIVTVDDRTPVTVAPEPQPTLVIEALEGRDATVSAPPPAATETTEPKIGVVTVDDKPPAEAGSASQPESTPKAEDVRQAVVPDGAAAEPKPAEETAQEPESSQPVPPVATDDNVPEESRQVAVPDASAAAPKPAEETAQEPESPPVPPVAAEEAKQDESQQAAVPEEPATEARSAETETERAQGDAPLEAVPLPIARPDPATAKQVWRRKPRKRKKVDVFTGAPAPTTD